MALKTSTGYAYHVNNTGSARNALEGGGTAGFLLEFYKGTEPASPDDLAPGADKLATYSLGGNGTGMVWEGTGRLLRKPAAAVWQSTVAAAGTASWFRFVRVGDTGAASTSAQRLQGSISNDIATRPDILLSNTAFVANETRTLSDFVLELPMQSAA